MDDCVSEDEGRYEQHAMGCGKVELKEDYKLLLTFADGSKKIYGCKSLLDKPIYEKLKPPSFLKNLTLSCGLVAWDNDADIAPEHVYKATRICEDEVISD